jgi:farnesyl diphosphate synthase
MPTTLKEFESVFPQLVDDLIGHAKAYGVPENGLNWYRQVKNNNKPEYLPLSSVL